MKWYSEDELKKWMGHSITLPLLAQMKYKEKRQCGDCPFWWDSGYYIGKCRLREAKNQDPFTYATDECQEGFAR